MKRVFACAYMAGVICAAGVMCAVVVQAAPDFEALGRAVVADLAAGTFDKVVDRFDPKMAAALPKEKLSATWNRLVGQVGAFKSVTGTRLQELPAQRLHVMELTSAFEKTNLPIRVVFTDEEKIAGLTIVPVPPPVAQ